jgi:hypothetical protein
VIGLESRGSSGGWAAGKIRQTGEVGGHVEHRAVAARAA